MKHCSRKVCRRLKLFGAGFALFFSMFSLFAATLAWFNTNRTVRSEGMLVRATSEATSIDSITLCKFTYPIVDGEALYLNPSLGTVNTYSFVRAHSRFEDSNGNPQTMNLFDPVLVELGTDLRDLYCNAVFIVELSASKPSATLQVFAELLNKVKPNDSDFYLSDCVDFDIYTPADLAAVTGKGYYPSHIEDVTNTTLTGYDEIFYKIAYLSSNDTHANFYSTNPKPSNIAIHDSLHPKTLNFSNSTSTFYINVNYAPSQLERYASSLAVENRNGIYDYAFTVNLL